MPDATNVTNPSNPMNPTNPAMYEKGKLYDLPLNSLTPDPDQPRKIMEPQALEELTASILRHGVLEPILFRTDGDASASFVVAGERRVAAAQKAGLTTIPGIYVDGNDAEIALVENLLRQDLTAVEEAEALQRLLEEQNYTHEQLSSVIGKARTTISDILLINRLPVEVRDDCRGDRRISKNSLIEIARKKQARSMTTAYNAYKEKLDKVKQPRKKDPATAPQNFIDILEKMTEKLGALDTKTWVEEDKISLQMVLDKLRKQIDAFMQP